MRRTLGTLGLALALVATGGGTAQAHPGETALDFDHSFVGLAAFFDASGTVVRQSSPPADRCRRHHCISFGRGSAGYSTDA